MKKYLRYGVICTLVFCFWWGVLFPQPWQREAIPAALTEEPPEFRFFFLEKLEEARNWIENRN